MPLVKEISDALQLPEIYLLKLARTASHCYKTYTIPKRAGGERIIHHPSKELKAIQRCLLEHVVTKWPVSPCAGAYVKGKNIADNARVHVSGRYLLRLDLSNFFPSITAEDIRNYLDTHPPSVESWNPKPGGIIMGHSCRLL